MTRASILTNGLDGLASSSPTIALIVKELFTLDDELQRAHQDAKRDDENGERVVVAYKAFLYCREKLIKQLQKDGIQAPWQLRTRIDDIELTLRQRKEKEGGNAAERPSVADANKRSTGAEAISSTAHGVDSAGANGGVAQQDAAESDPLLPLKAMIIPSALIALIAALVYSIASMAE